MYTKMFMFMFFPLYFVYCPSLVFMNLVELWINQPSLEGGSECIMQCTTDKTKAF